MSWALGWLLGVQWWAGQVPELTGLTNAMATGVRRDLSPKGGGGGVGKEVERALISWHWGHRFLEFPGGNNECGFLKGGHYT